VSDVTPIPPALALLDATVLDRRVEGGGFACLTLDVGGTEVPSTWRVPGQYLAAATPGLPPRYFAIASPADEPTQIELLVAPGSPTSDALCETRSGDRVGLSPALGAGYPVGVFRSLPLVVFGTGTGIAAVRPLLFHRARTGDGARTWLYQAHGPGGAPFASDHAAWRAAGIGVVALGPDDPRGFVQDVFAQAPPIDPPANAHYVVCGSEGIQSAIDARLRALGVPPTQIHYNY
jgi:NAD(P)H-flavin reductase